MNWLILVIGIFIKSQIKECKSQIFTGFDVQSDDYNYHVAIFYDDKYRCAGGIVDENYVVTAAHCVDNPDEDLFAVVIGLQYPRDKRQIHLVENILLNLFPRPLNDLNEIVLIKLETPVLLGDYAGAIKLPTAPTSSDEATICSISGLERNTELMPVADLKLVWTKLILITTMEAECFCRREMSPTPLYAIGLIGTKLTPGDSGSVLVCNGVAVGILRGMMYRNDTTDHTIVYIVDRIYDRLELIKKRGRVFNSILSNIE